MTRGSGAGSTRCVSAQARRSDVNRLLAVLAVAALAGASPPGRIILQVGYDEVSFDLIDRADAVVVDRGGVPPDHG